MFESTTPLRNFIMIRQKSRDQLTGCQRSCSQANPELVSKVTTFAHHGTIDLLHREELLVVLCIAKVPCRKEACHLAQLPRNKLHLC